VKRERGKKRGRKERQIKQKAYYTNNNNQQKYKNSEHTANRNKIK